MPTATLRKIEGLQSITIQTDDGKTIRLVPGEPAVIADQDKRLVAAIQRFPIDLTETATIQSKPPGS